MTNSCFRNSFKVLEIAFHKVVWSVVDFLLNSGCLDCPLFCVSITYVYWLRIKYLEQWNFDNAIRVKPPEHLWKQSLVFLGPFLFNSRRAKAIVQKQFKVLIWSHEAAWPGKRKAQTSVLQLLALTNSFHHLLNNPVKVLALLGNSFNKLLKSSQINFQIRWATGSRQKPSDCAIV